MKIVKLTIHNFLKLLDIEMNPSDKVNVIVGKNKQGKTSVLKAIRAAFDGDVDDTSIRNGEGKAEIIVELDDLTIKRSVTQKGNYLDISNKEGMKMPAPQKFLDGILGQFSFNPIEFFDKKSADRKKYLLNAIKINITQEELSNYTGEKLAGLDYSLHALEVIESARKYYYDKRTVANATVAQKEKTLQDLNEKIPSGFDPNSVNEENIKKIRDAIMTDEKNRDAAIAHQTLMDTKVAQAIDIGNQIKELEEKKKAIESEVVEMSKIKFDFSDEATISAAKTTLEDLESKRDILFTVKRADEVRAELNAAIEEAQKLDSIVVKLTKDVPQDLISKAKLPVDGLTIVDNDILINGISIDNLSSSEQLKFGLDVVRALNDGFKIICVDGIETLDKESFDNFLKEIENDDFQYFVTRVEGNTPHSIEIENGSIKK